MAKTEFPEEAYVYICDRDAKTDEPIFVITSDLTEVADGAVAKYKLVKVGKKITDHRVI